MPVAEGAWPNPMLSDRPRMLETSSSRELKGVFVGRPGSKVTERRTARNRMIAPPAVLFTPGDLPPFGRPISWCE